jgi:predicted amidohydrolase
MYNDRQVEVIDRFTGKLQPWMGAARRRGVLFDLGHGGGSFLWPVATKAMAQGFPPDTISTDLHSSSIMIPESDMPNCISKLMALGMTLQDGILRSTVNPARAIHRFPELGTLGEGRVADVAVFRLATGAFAYKDAWQNKLLAGKRLETVVTIRAGEVVFEADPMMSSAAGQEIYDVILKGGHVIDPKNGRNGRMDIAITADRVRKISQRIPAAAGRRVVDLSDYHVVPGLIDMQARFTANGLSQDHTTLRYGVTTAVITGQAEAMKRSKTRVIVAGKQEARDAISSSNAASMTSAMSKALASGLPLAQVIERATVVPAKALARPELGGIDEGGIADIAVLDTSGKRVRCILTIRNGDVVWDTQGLSLTDWKEAGPYSNFK